MTLLPPLLIALFSVAPPIGVVAARHEEPIRKIADIRRLSREEAARERRVEVWGTVTAYDPTRWSFFVQDDSAGIYFHYDDLGTPLEVGWEVQIHGVVKAGDFAPTIMPSDVRIIGPGVIPKDNPISISQTHAGALDSQWITVEGVVQRVSKGEVGHPLLRLTRGLESIEVSLPMDRMGLAQSLVGARISVSGPCATSFRNGRWLSASIPVTDPRTLKVIRPAPTLESMTIRTAADLMEFSAVSEPEEMVRVRGAVTLAPVNGAGFIEDPTGPMAIEVEHGDLLPPLGHRLDFTAFRRPSADHSTLPRLRVSRFIDMGPAASPEAVDLNDDLPGPELDGRRVTVLVRLLDVNRTIDGWRVLGTRSVGPDAEGAVEAMYAADNGAEALKRLVPGSLVRLEGIYSKPESARSLASQPSLVVLQSNGSAAEIEVISGPLWWTESRVRFALAAMAAAAALLAIIVVLSRWTIHRKVAELAASHRREASALTVFQRFIDQAPDLIFSLGSDLRIGECNQAAREFFSVRFGDGCEGRSLAELGPGLTDGLESAIPGEPIRGHWTIPGADGQPREHDVVLRPILRPGETRPGFEVIARDVTDRVRAQTELRRAETLAMSGRLAASVAHDFNNLLTVIGGCSELLEERIGDDARLRPLVHDLRDAAIRADVLTGSLLAFSGRHSPMPEVTAVSALIRKSAGLLRRLLGESVRLEINIADALPPIRIDPAMFDQLLLNLAVNARQAQPTGGRFRIVGSIGRMPAPSSRTETDETSALEGIGPAPESESGAGTEIDAVVLEFSDDGVGMSRETMARVFEPFFTTRSTEGGTGLGLVIVRSVVERFGGDIVIRSEPGAGTTFSVRFPALPARLAPPCSLPPRNGNDGAEAATSSPNAIAPGTGPSDASPGISKTQGPPSRILLVEDEPPVRQLLTALLQGSGVSVRSCATAEDALELAAQSSFPFDLLITDVVLPGRSGPELARELRRSRPELPVLFVSGFAPEQILGSFEPDPITAFERKPISRTSLVGAIRRLHPTDAGPLRA